ncbi:hypothetical protein OKW50_002947 [Paraburkholderia youngii]|uniref:Uncharacterized protein n=1 Tax=Paraburkholderia youngii TaxID=2782701 RepID=A0A7W8L4V7_9BURK|nr:hypothetical protein [Paraburkholderia youngii]MBB5400452.1 hypothetical protein [Paraburkholderia youngii]NVI05457.1 hypothetical protein [Paraburkholderia youngii]
MLYLKNTLGGLSRSLTDSALQSFQGRHRWWKLALFAGLFVLPGGSVGVALLAWAEHRRETKRAKKGNAVIVDSSEIVLPKESFAIETENVVAATANSGNACLASGGASCRASAGRLACQRQRQRQQTQSTETRL